MPTKFISGVANVQAPLIRKDTAFGSKVSSNMDMMRHSEERHVPPAVLAVKAVLQDEGWTVSILPGRKMRIAANGFDYERLFDWLLGCDYSDVSPMLANDIMDAMQSLGLCGGP